MLNNVQTETHTLRAASQYVHKGSSDAFNEETHQLQQSITIYVNTINVIHPKCNGYLWMTATAVPANTNISV